MNSFDKLVADSAIHLGWAPRRDPALEDVVRRIQQLRTSHHLGAVAIANMLTGEGKAAALRTEEFVQFVIDRT
ncbi:hypothetical protein CFP71_42220 [Amycolatopsis thailandensis]|uniref:Uncharacterized protein n=1 Tax=Amycolatopsis thailandensis TaxID=589330 RepID=A0A229R8E0_9PSEU|nr:hypothetical protein [Amycolatopsis thailandensis]OXM42749.1 hypothetical protein CFP71_42220 [Amycolatopsis thailandensis]